MITVIVIVTVTIAIVIARVVVIVIDFVLQRTALLLSSLLLLSLLPIALDCTVLLSVFVLSCLASYDLFCMVWLHAGYAIELPGRKSSICGV
jgi:hypothetical protein